jgi:hypothetical protein
VASDPRRRYAKQASCLWYVYQILGWSTMARCGYGRSVWLWIGLYRQTKLPQSISLPGGLTASANPLCPGRARYGTNCLTTPAAVEAGRRTSFNAARIRSVYFRCHAFIPPYIQINLRRACSGMTYYPSVGVNPPGLVVPCVSKPLSP